MDSSVTILLDKNMRITEIKKALRESDKPIEIMAEENGFISMQTMTRNFIEELGISPVKFRKDIKQRIKDYGDNVADGGKC